MEKKSILVVILVLTIFIVGCDLDITDFIDIELDNAIKTNNPDNCAKLKENDSTSRVDECLSKIAENLKDSKICQEVTDTYSKGNCYQGVAVQKGDPQLCLMLDFIFRPACFSAVAQKTEDYKVCDNIENNAQEKDNCLSQVATAKNSLDICGKITSSELHDRCISSVATGSKDESMCGGIMDDYRQETCYYDVAKANHDASTCYKIAKAESVQICIGDVAISSKNPEFCKELTNPLKKQECYKFVAVSAEQATICNEITTESIKDDCFYRVAYAKLEPGLCTRIVSIAGADNCIKEIALAKHDIKICDSTVDTINKQACQDQFKN
jgi:hypothetical protein